MKKKLSFVVFIMCTTLNIFPSTRNNHGDDNHHQKRMREAEPALPVTDLQNQDMDKEPSLKRQRLEKIIDTETSFSLHMQECLQNKNSNTLPQTHIINFLNQSQIMPYRRIDSSWKRIIDEGPNIIILNFCLLNPAIYSGALKITPELFAALGKWCPNVTVISLAWNNGITDKLLQVISENFKNLVYLNLNCCNLCQEEQITGDGLLSLKACKQLQYLDVADNEAIDDGTIQTLQEALPNLNIIKESSFDEFSSDDEASETDIGSLA